jgi:starch synthase
MGGEQMAGLKIVMIASEAVPFIKTGGLADVVGALPKALQDLGHQVIVVLPRYSAINGERHGLTPSISPLGVWMGDREEWCTVYAADQDGIPFYFIESQQHFDRFGLYHDADLNDYLDNPRRFSFLTRAGLQLCRDLGFAPDIVHVHDWQTALASAYLKIWHQDDPVLGRAASLLTIHNLAYQGVYDASHYNYLGLQWGNFTGDRFEDHGRVNMLKGGIVFADMVNTVSPTYAKETRTSEGGMGLAPYLNDKGDRYLGILNGVDYTQWNPALDRRIPARYSPDDLSGKLVCKRELQLRMGLEVNLDLPLIGIVSRFAEQKGLGMAASAMGDILNSMAVQVVVLGSGEKGLEEFYGRLPDLYPGRVGSYIGYNDDLAHWIEAGADFFLMPSLFEPCGLNQIYSLKYGTLPIVRATGGLEDTVQQYDERSGAGTGFKFYYPSASSITDTVGWAVSTYFDRPHHILQMMLTAMEQDFSWERSARAYEEVYRRAAGIRQASA